MISVPGILLKRKRLKEKDFLFEQECKFGKKEWIISWGYGFHSSYVPYDKSTRFCFVLFCFYLFPFFGISLSLFIFWVLRTKEGQVPFLQVWLFEWWNNHGKKIRFRAWLHGEFQPGVKFCSAHWAEILLWLHAQFQPRRKTQISVRKFTEVRKHSQCACSVWEYRARIFSPGWIAPQAQSLSM